MKKFLAVLAAISAAVMLAGCSGDPQPASTVFNEPRHGEPSGSASDLSDPVGSGESGGGSSFGSENSSSNSDQSAPDLGEAAENVWLFGKKIPLPCRFEDFGEDFSLGEEYFYQMKEDLIAFLCYKGKIIGEVILENCTEDDPNKSAKKVVQLALGNAADNPVSTEGWYNEEIYFDVMGVTMRSGFDDVKELLGKPSKNKGTAQNGTIEYKISDEDFIEITFKAGKLVEFVIESR